MDAADPGREAHRCGGVSDRWAVGRREPDHDGRGAVPGLRFAAGVADVPAVRPVGPPRAADDGDGRPRRALQWAARCSIRRPRGLRAERGGEQVVLVRKETNPDDLAGIIAADGILTARGGKTSHAAVVARGMGKTCVCGAEALDVDASTRTARVGTVLIKEGDEISIDGSTGEIFLGAMPVVPSPVETYIESGLAVALDGADDETTALVTAVDRALTHADARRRLAIRANADTAEDAVRARSLGAQGIGLCRTEHMFLGDRRVLIERVILAGTTEERDDAEADVVAPAAQGFHGVARRDGRAAGEYPAAGPAAARVLAGSHRTRGQGRPRRGQG